MFVRKAIISVSHVIEFEITPGYYFCVTLVWSCDAQTGNESWVSPTFQ